MTRFLAAFVFGIVGLFSLSLNALTIWGSHFFASLPMRRRERGRLFIDLLTSGMDDGHSAEHSIVAIAGSRDRSLGVGLHLLAAYIQQGMRLGQALGAVPRFLPPPVAAMLRTGEAIGDIGKVLPVCRQALGDSTTHARGAMNSLVFMALVVTPTPPAILGVLGLFVFPKLRILLQDFGASEPAFTAFILGHTHALALLFVVSMCGIAGAAVIHVGGPRLANALNFGPLKLADRVACWLPWTWNKLRHDFASMLGLLLDAGVPEARAVEMAGAGTANAVFHCRTERVVHLLNHGDKLSTALRGLDGDGEFAWRIENAGRSPAGFRVALDGWLELLAARAFRQRQTVVHVLTSGLILLNGLVIGTVVICVFQLILSMLGAALLW
jgi:type II secretory pathway component PulF